MPQKSQPSEPRGHRFAVAVIVVAILLVATHADLHSQAQTASPVPPAFEAATVKLNNSGSGSSSTNSTNGLLRITNQTLLSMIQRAYNVRDFQISGGPAWLRSDRYDVVAKPENGAHAQQMMDLLKTLLAERFQLRIHRETRSGAVYALVVAKGGSKLQLAAESPDSGITSGRDPDTARLFMKGMRATTDEIAASLAARVGRPVVNRTELAGKFDFELSWLPDLTSSSSSDAPPDISGPSIFTAVQEQLGLRLESDKGEIEILVIDKAERPVLDN